MAEQKKRYEDEGDGNVGGLVGLLRGLTTPIPGRYVEMSGNQPLKAERDVGSRGLLIDHLLSGARGDYAAMHPDEPKRGAEDDKVDRTSYSPGVEGWGLDSHKPQGSGDAGQKIAEERLALMPQSQYEHDPRGAEDSVEKGGAVGLLESLLAPTRFAPGDTRVSDVKGIEGSDPGSALLRALFRLGDGTRANPKAEQILGDRSWNETAYGHDGLKDKAKK